MVLAGGDDVVYVPARPAMRGTPKEVVFETRPLPDGRQFGLAFSSADALVTSLGDYQPWVALPLKDFCEILGARGVERIAFDPQIPEQGWRWTQERLDELAGSADG